jgi:hypothetical protein
MKNSQTIGWYFSIFERYRFGIILGALLTLCAFFAFSPNPASALTTVPTKMNFQGRLTDSAGNIKPNGTYNMKLRLYTVNSGGSAVWTEDRLVSAGNGVTVTNGLFSIQLGSVTTLPATLFASGALYLEVELPTPASATTTSPVWTEGAMTPRNQMATSAYAYNSETLDGKDSTDFGQLVANNTWTGAYNIFNGEVQINAGLLPVSVSADEIAFTAGVNGFTVNTEGAFAVQNSIGQTLINANPTNSTITVSTVAPVTGATVGSNINREVPAASHRDTAVGSDGNVWMVYKSGVGTNLLRCTAVDCSTYVDTNVVADTGSGLYPSIVVGSDGFARLAYYTQTGQDLAFVRCTNLNCSTKVVTIADSTGNVGGDTSMALGSDGFARISYSDNQNSDLRYTQCLNADCSLTSSSAVDSAGQSAWNFTSLKMGPDGFPRILYDDNATKTIKYVQCTNAACTTNVITTIESGFNSVWASLAIAPDGFARFAYDIPGYGYRYVQCTNATCSTKNSKTIDSVASDYIDLALGSDGFARIAYRSGTDADLKYTLCNDAACSAPVNSIVDGYQQKGSDVSLVLVSGDTAMITHSGNVDGVYKSFVTRLTSATGAEVRTGMNIGSSSAAFAEIYAKLLNANGITIDASTHDEYGPAIDIVSNGDYINTKNELGEERFKVSNEYFSYRNDAASFSMNQTGTFNVYSQSSNAAAYISQDGPGVGLLVESNLMLGTTLLKLSNGNTGGVPLTVTEMGKTTFMIEDPVVDGFSVGDYSSTLFSVDNANRRVRIGPQTADATGVVLVLDDKNTAGDPTGVDGAMYYNSSAGKFRCYQGAWSDCISGQYIPLTMLSSTWTDAQTIYFGNAAVGLSSASGQRKIYFPKAGTIKMAKVWSYATVAGSGEAWSMYVRKNDTTDTLIQTVSSAAAERSWTNNSLSISVAAGDYVEIKGVNPTWVTNPSALSVGGYLYFE